MLLLSPPHSSSSGSKRLRRTRIEQRRLDKTFDLVPEFAAISIYSGVVNLSHQPSRDNRTSIVMSVTHNHQKIGDKIVDETIEKIVDETSLSFVVVGKGDDKTF